MVEVLINSDIFSESHEMLLGYGTVKAMSV
jgi:hypothetical protein